MSSREYEKKKRVESHDVEDCKQRLGEVEDDATASFVLEHEQLERRDRTIRVFFAFLFRP